MIGRYQLQLGAEQMASGMSSSDFATDGALGVSSVQLNPFLVPGAMYSLASPTDLSTNVVSNIIASAAAPNTSYLRTFVDDAGNYYTTDGSTTTKRATATTNAAYYSAGTTDMVAFGASVYVTTATDIDLWNPSTLTLTNSWWAGTKGKTILASSVRHPMLVYGPNLYVADNAQIHQITNGGSINTLTAFPFIVNPVEVITALGIDPATGLMMIAVQEDVNYSDIKYLKSYVYLYDGVSANVTRKIPVDEMVSAFYNVEGMVYVGYGRNLGVWNGNGITYLRQLQFVSFGTATDLPYKHHFSNTNKVLHVIDGPQVLSYGPVISGKRAFFYTAGNVNDSSHLTCLVPISSTKMGVAYKTNGTPLLKVSDLNSQSSGVGTMYFNNIYLPRPIVIDRVRIITTGVTTGSNQGQLGIFDEKGTLHSAANASFSVTAAASPQYVFDFNYGNLKLQAIQPRFIWGGQPFGVIRIIIYYNVVE